MEQTFDKTTNMDSVDQMVAVAASSTSIIVDFFENTNPTAQSPSLIDIRQFRSQVASQATTLHAKLRTEFLTGARGPAPASSQLGKTRIMYDFIRKTLGIRMHGAENHGQFSNGIGAGGVSIGSNISKIYEVCWTLKFGASVATNLFWWLNRQ